MQALIPARVFTGDAMIDDRAVLVEDGHIAAVLPLADIPLGADRLDLGDGLLAPGFVDLQVNGGGGVLFNDRPTVDGLHTIARAHRAHGTTGFLPTLITTETATMVEAREAAKRGLREVPGVLGIHFEGPHLNPARAGVHDPALMRPLEPEDVDLVATPGLGRTLVTLAPERSAPDLVQVLAERGVVVAAGHTNATYEELAAACDAGVTAVTHLFNAMSPFTAREPGAVGAALALPGLACGIIADGHHVHPASLRVARAAKPGGKLFLVTDAMPPVGCDLDHFELDGQVIAVERPHAPCPGRPQPVPRCVNHEGRLAGSALDMASAVRLAHALGGIPLEMALRMASLDPAHVIGLGHERGRIAPGFRADLVLLAPDLGVRATWIGGDPLWSAAVDPAPGP